MILWTGVYIAYAPVRIYNRLYNGLAMQPSERMGQMASKLEKKDVIGEIITLYDRIAELEAEQSESKRECEDKYAEIDKHVMRAGCKAILKDSLAFWHSVSVHRGEEGRLIAEPFKDWQEKAVVKVPDAFSRVMFFDYFHEDLYSIYMEDRAKAIEVLKSTEAKSKEKEADGAQD